MKRLVRRLTRNRVKVGDQIQDLTVPSKPVYRVARVDKDSIVTERVRGVSGNYPKNRRGISWRKVN